MPKIGWSQLRQIDAIPLMIPWATGRFYSNPFFRSLSTGVGSNTFMYAVPFYVPNLAGVTITSIGVEITITGTLSTARLGIYSANNELIPQELLLDAGTIDTTAAAGFLSIVVSKFLKQGWYYMAIVNTSTVIPTYRRSGGVQNFLGNCTYVDTQVYREFNGVIQTAGGLAFTTNGLPKTFPLVFYGISDDSACPRLMVGI